ncbi:MFS transporter [Streptomyces sp. NBC_01446]|uniref:MFS transporter n=1 Tax=Streptomyces sp. NBC_01446 TaxID=2903870 RepID=UPI0022596B61|nr:MFS transporter [Streptomyces sp. NBC_01446]MCX4641954.1 MFS transporter [Streptomyces sp. NBC_01446]
MKDETPLSGSRAGPATALEPPPSAAGPRRVSAGYLFWMVAANFGVSMAYVLPLTYTLTLRIDQLAPGREEVLGYVTGIAQVVYLVASPLLGIWSDRTCSPLGRRQPFLVGGSVLGLVALTSISLAPSLFLIEVGWIVAMLGWATASQAILTLQADRVPEEQRGKVSGLTAATGQISPVIGIAVAAVLPGTLLVFVVPGVLGLALAMTFAVRGPEPDSRTTITAAEPVSLKKILASYVFNPRRHPDFGWNWLGRFVFFMGLYFNTTFSTFFYSQRLDLPVKDVAGAVATAGMVGIVAAMAGAVGGGFLSDRLARRRLFTMIGAVLFTCGAVVEAFAYSFPMLVVGSVLMQLAIAAFSSVDQAIAMAVLPDRGEAGRYMAAVAFSQKIPSALAPLIAPVIIALSTSGDTKNYTALYLTGAVFALIVGLLIVTRVRSVR